MSYEKHTWVNNETITAAKLNNIEDGIEEAAQSGGGGYDLVILGTTAEDSQYIWTASDFSVVSGSLAACEQKVLNNEPVNGLVILAHHTGIYDWSHYGRVCTFDVSYRYITIDFGAPLDDANVWSLGYNSTYEFTTFEK